MKKKAAEECCPLCQMMEEEMGVTEGIPFDRMIEQGMLLPPADQLDDQAVHWKLWEIIRALAGFRIFLDDTDHLSDRDLYRELWTRTLREKIWITTDSNSATHIGFVSSGSEEDTRLWLTYYADDETRADWKISFPEDQLPEKKILPYDRDRLLPIASRKGSERSAS